MDDLRLIISGPEVEGAETSGDPPLGKDATAFLGFLSACSERVHDELSLYCVDRSDLHTAAAAIVATMKRMDAEERPVLLLDALDTLRPDLPPFDLYGENLNPEQMHEWAVLFGAAAILCIERAADCTHQNRPYEAAFLMVEYQEMANRMRIAILNPRRMFASQASEAQHASKKAVLADAWEHFKKAKYSSLAEGARACAKHYRDGPVTYRGFLDYFREQAKAEGITFKSGRPPKVAKKPLKRAA